MAQQQEQRLKTLAASATRVQQAWETFTDQATARLNKIWGMYGEDMCRQLKVQGEGECGKLERACKRWVYHEQLNEASERISTLNEQYAEALAGGSQDDISTAKSESKSIVTKINTLQKEEARKAKVGGTLDDKQKRKLKRLQGEMDNLWGSLSQWLDRLEVAVVALRGFDSEWNLTTQYLWSDQQGSMMKQLGGLMMIRACQIVASGESFDSPEDEVVVDKKK